MACHCQIELYSQSLIYLHIDRKEVVLHSGRGEYHRINFTVDTHVEAEESRRFS